MIAPILEGDRIILKPIELKHAALRYKWYRDPQVAKYQDFINVSLKEISSTIIKRRKRKDYFGWLIFINKSNLVIGEIQLRRVDFDNRTAVLSVNIGETQFWRQGFATEATKIVSRFFFNKLRLNRIELDVVPANIGAIRCYQKCGFKKEGIRRQANLKKGKFYDLILMGLLQSEYFKKSKVKSKI